MTEMNTGIYGAKVQSWGRANPREVLARLVDKHPEMSREEIFAAMRDFFDSPEGREHAAVVHDYWTANNLAALLPQMPSRPRASSTKSAPLTVEGIKRGVRELVKEEARVMLLDLLMPNGKLLRDCTGKECGYIAGKVGGWLKRVAERVKPDQTVGAALSEAQIRKLYDR